MQNYDFFAKLQNVSGKNEKMEKKVEGFQITTKEPQRIAALKLKTPHYKLIADN